MTRSSRAFFVVIIAVMAMGSHAAASGTITGVHGLSAVARLTGAPSLNNTTSPYDIGGTDLGIPIDHNDKTYFLFGDTFSGEDPSYGGNWRRNTVAWSSDTTPSDGIIFDGWAIDPGTGKAKQTFTNNVPSNVITNIPTGGIDINGSMYAWFMNVTQWGPAGGEWYIRQAELARWNDATDSFSLVNNSTFAGNGNFGMVAVREGVDGDPYIYMWGTPAGRFGSGVKLARFLPSQIEDRAAYQFYDGRIGGVPQWTSDEFAGDFVVTGSVGEMSVMYNRAVGAWTMLYFNEINDRIQIRQSNTPWGPWSDAITVMKASQCPGGTFGLYGPYMHPRWTENEGAAIYFTLSLWNPYDVYMAKVTLDFTAIAPTIQSTTLSPAMAAAGDDIHVAVSATDPSGIASVKANGAALANTIGTTWEGSIAASASTGDHVVTIVATGLSGLTATDSSAHYTTAPVIGTTPKSVSSPLMAWAASRWLFKVWGKATTLDENWFTLDDGSGTHIRVFAPGYTGIANGDSVSATGILTPGAIPTITAQPAHVSRLGN